MLTVHTKTAPEESASLDDTLCGGADMIATLLRFSQGVDCVAPVVFFLFFLSITSVRLFVCVCTQAHLHFSHLKANFSDRSQSSSLRLCDKGKAPPSVFVVCGHVPSN